LVTTLVLLVAACDSSTSTDGGVDSGVPDGGCDTTLAVDPCPAGRYCTPAGPLDHYGTCQLPGELENYCVPDAGCNGAGLVCQNGFPLPDGGDGSACVYDCAQASDCPSVDTTCVTPANGGHKLCYFNFCGPGAMPPNGTDFYEPCDSGGGVKNDAFCIPGTDFAGNIIGRCLAAGTADAGCERTRVNGDTSQVCEIGSLCFLGSSGNTRCLQVCAATSPTAPDGGPDCPTGDICFNDFTPWGYCVQQCSPTADGGASCPTGTQCSVLAQGTYGCVP
jgi:hypothetical protein